MSSEIELSANTRTSVTRQNSNVSHQNHRKKLGCDGQQLPTSDIVHTDTGANTVP